MHRRKLIGLCGAIVTGLAGCSSRSGDGGSSPTDRNRTSTSADDPTTTSEERPTTTATPTADGPRGVPTGRTVVAGDVRVTVENPRVRKYVVRNGVHRFLEGHDGQYVVVDVTTDGPVGEDLPLRSSVGGDSLSDGGPIRLRGLDGATPRSPAEWDGDRIAFPFPARHHDAAGIRWNGPDRPVVWAFPAAVRETVALEPAFRVEDLRTRRSDGDLLLAMTVRNDGDRDGRFLAQVSMAGFSGRRIVRFDVPAGASRDYEGRANGLLEMFENSGGGTLTVTAPDGDDLATTELDPTTVTTGSGG